MSGATATKGPASPGSPQASRPARSASCDCKVVPSFSGDKDEEVVEGACPQEYRRQWERFKEIDEDESLTWQQRREIKMDSFPEATESCIRPEQQASGRMENSVSM